MATDDQTAARSPKPVAVPREGIRSGVHSTRAPQTTKIATGNLVDGRYLVGEIIGTGAFGLVFEAKNVELDEKVALKTMRPEIAVDTAMVARFAREAKAAASIKSEYVATVYDVGTGADGLPYIVMEYLDGKNLGDHVETSGPIGAQQAVEYALQICEALAVAHAKGIVHRDIKPENLLLTERAGGMRIVKVLDFGISKTMRPSDGDLEVRLTHTGMVLGTPLYMSPEQARGEDRIDHRIDVYALGVILYECLTGEVPFRGTNYLGIISDVLTRVPLAPRQVRPDLLIAPSLDRVVAQAMERDRELRYPSMAALAADLRRVAAGDSLEEPAAVAAPPTVRRGRRLVYLGMFAIFAIVIGMTAMVASRAVAPLPSPAPVQPAPVASRLPVPVPAPAPVRLEIRSTPPGAEIRNGDRVLGRTPGVVELARSEKAIRLTFFKDGFEIGSTDVVPAHDGELVDIFLRPRREPAPLVPAARPAAAAGHRRAHRSPDAAPKTFSRDPPIVDEWRKVKGH